jgi:hypothetical protein
MPSKRSTARNTVNRNFPAPNTPKVWKTLPTRKKIRFPLPSAKLRRRQKRKTLPMKTCKNTRTKSTAIQKFPAVTAGNSPGKVAPPPHRYAFPRIFAAHHRDPTSKNRQSLKNSGGLPSAACPINCSTHPNTNNPSATHNSRCQKIPANATGPETIMSGIPNVCVIRFTGC